MTTRPPRAWLMTLGLAILAVTGAVLAASTSSPAAAETVQAAEPCFSYGRFECCPRPGE